MTKSRHGASFAAYCLEKVDNKGQRAIRQKNVSVGMKEKATGDEEIYISREQKNVGGDTMEIIARYKSEPFGEGLELVRERNGSQSENK